MTFNEVITQLTRYIHRINDVDIIQMCGLAKGTVTTTLKTTNDITYFIYNQQAQKTAGTGNTITACEVQGADTYCYYLVSINLSGTILTTKGTDNVNALPVTPAGYTPIGAFKIVTVGVTFTAGTTALDAAGITATFFDIDCGMATFLVNQAMRKMERKFNFRGMFLRTNYTLVAATEIFNNPVASYKRLDDIYGKNSAGTRYPMKKKDIHTVEQAYPSGRTGPPALIAEVPAIQSPDISPNLQMIIRPVPDIQYTIVFTGYRYTPYLDGIFYATNWWTENHPDVLIYAALCEAITYLKTEDNRIMTWKTLFKEVFDDLKRAEIEEQYAGSDQYLEAENVI